MNIICLIKFNINQVNNIWTNPSVKKQQNLQNIERNKIGKFALSSTEVEKHD